MLTRIFTLLLFCASLVKAQEAIDPSSIAVVYNSNNPESSKLAFYYANARNIPHDNLIGLATSNKGKISRNEYISTIQDPLRSHFDRNRWWSRAKTSDGYVMPVKNKMRLLVCMYGLPYGINNQKLSSDTDLKKLHVVQRSNSASVDSELVLFGVDGVPIQGALPNKYYKKDANFSKLNDLLPYMLVGRIDGPSYATAQRLIDDAIAVEKQGLWGMCYLDKAFKGGSYKIGDEWMDTIYKANWQKGIPTTMENTRQTYLTNYPMRDAALYYGWYTSSRNGPLLDPNFRFKKGAIAIHLHSSSASNLRNKNSNWVGPLLDKGAAATVGNVYEPYLQLTHQFDIINDRLLAGYTFAEATAMSIPYISWQSLAIGDPLYRPFLHKASSGTTVDEDKLYRAVGLAFTAWKGDDEKIAQRLRTAAIQKKDARFYEILGLWSLFKKDTKDAMSYFFPAQKLYTEESDQIRISLHLAQLYRSLKDKKSAINTLKTAHAKKPTAAASKTLQAMINVLQPPAPKPAQPRKK